jgi:hypothetical protein
LRPTVHNQTHNQPNKNPSQLKGERVVQDFDRITKPMVSSNELRAFKKLENVISILSVALNVSNVLIHRCESRLDCGTGQHELNNENRSEEVHVRVAKSFVELIEAESVPRNLNQRIN